MRPDARLLNEERKLITHAIRMSAYNAESILARMLHGHYARADDEARALVREAFTLSGDIDVRDGQLHVRLDPATAPRRSRALAALCQELTATERSTRIDLTIAYGQTPPRPVMINPTMSIVPGPRMQVQNGVLPAKMI